MTDWTETETSGLEPGSEHRVRLGFERETVTVALDQLVPLKILQQGVRESKKFAQIVSSIKAIGIVEAPAVAPDPKHPGKYFLLDGHLRIEALRQLAIPTVECLVANDDETYTYNKRVNRLPPVQEHRMIVRAIERAFITSRILGRTQLCSSCAILKPVSMSSSVLANLDTLNLSNCARERAVTSKPRFFTSFGH